MLKAGRIRCGGARCISPDTAMRPNPLFRISACLCCEHPTLPISVANSDTQNSVIRL